MTCIFIEDSFDSAHFLPNVAEGHKCRTMHGHTYRIRLEIEGPVGERTGWIMDYAVAREAWLLVKARLDHQLLNGVTGLENPTCELLADWIAERLSPSLAISRLELRETEHCGVVIYQ